MSVIKVDNITKDYGSGRGIFDLSFEVNRGEIFGMLGPNGAGKTTTIRQLMGFIKSDNGNAQILDMDCFINRENIQSKLGYLPAEIAFMEEMKGSEFIKFIAEMKSIKNKNRIKELSDFFELDANRKIKSMSKGTKQKIAIVCAFMNEPEVVILDEPTSGLDPLMQKKFIELILEEKKKGTTIFMSSHIFEEVEKTCGRTAILKEGKLIAIENMEELKSKKNKNFEVIFKTNKDAENFKNKISFKSELNNNTIKVVIANNEVNNFIKELSNYDVLDINSSTQSLEELFLHFYNK
ncbi:ABC transporter ATP-binding protein [Brachyspira pilosicoli]|uniref:ABC transporter ATP-binding protein n=1 Tax=Brachyspira pilosicoli TaxID=52584 RepID=UPI0030069E35